MRIEITQEDIDQARAEQAECNSSRCPLARAMERATGESCAIGLDDFTVYKRGGWLGGMLPPEARRFVRYFDQGVLVQPMILEIEEPRPWVEHMERWKERRGIGDHREERKDV